MICSICAIISRQDTYLVYGEPPLLLSRFFQYSSDQHIQTERHRDPVIPFDAYAVVVVVVPEAFREGNLFFCRIPIGVSRFLFVVLKANISWHITS